ncbi:MAG: uracil-DNA glycosylase [Candidatus Manganitrophaceae bacterium]|nr:MAG: uracil-DNA glycosylase [Candidatus Manganitrophaceae bacterium]
MRARTLPSLQKEVIHCTQCPRLVQYCSEIARTKRRAYREEEYWGKPVPGWGDPDARLLMIGLAPAAHGGNRTGRVFTGDASGDFLFRALHKAGFANQPTSRHRKDGLQLKGAYLTAVVHCAPPDNKPLPAEVETCRRYLVEELTILTKVKAVLVFGKIALDGFRAALRESSGIDLPAAATPFQHGASYEIARSKPRLFISYHPSRQNTQTGRLTEPMFDAVFLKIQAHLDRS